MDERNAGELLSAIERQQLALYLDTSTGGVPRWTFPALGLAAGGAVATIDLHNPWVTILAVFVAGAVIGAVIATIKRAGFSPRLSALPRPLQRQLRLFATIGVVAIAASLVYAVLASDADLPFTIAGLVIAIVIGVGGPIFERRYRTVAAQLAREAGIEHD